jgi:hypothetical protein
VPKLTFFQVAATVLPVLTLAALVELSLLSSLLRDGGRKATVLMLVVTLAFFGIAAGAEAVALSVLVTGKPTEIAALVIELALIFLVMLLASGPTRQLAGVLEDQGLGWVGYTGQLLVAVAGLAGMALIGSDLIAWALTGIVLVGGVAGIVGLARRGRTSR